MDGLPTLVQLLKQLQRVPYLASKNLQRVSQYFLTLDESQVQAFCQALLEARRNLILCPLCCAWQERSGHCVFCNSPKRDHATICVVETWHDLCAIERSGGYQGDYHVLGGALCPLEGVGPEDLTVEILVDRIGPVHKEIVLAMNQTPEGEATATYVVRSLRDKEIIITRLAQGVPAGGSLEYTDRLTLCKALSERKVY